MKSKKNSIGSKGFTLLEVLIVLVILAVLAGLAIPLYSATSEKARKAEALSTLSALRQSAVRFYAIDGKYPTALSAMDFQPAATAAGTTTDAAGQKIHWYYSVSTATAGFTATATRNTVDGGDGSSTVTINNTGAVLP